MQSPYGVVAGKARLVLISISITISMRRSSIRSRGKSNMFSVISIIIELKLIRTGYIEV